MDLAFILKSIEKKYGDFVLGPLDLELAPGKVMGYVGNNGAGKTTTINILAGLVLPDRGEARVAGMKNEHKHPEWKNFVGYVGESGGFFENWPVRKNLDFISGFYRSWNAQYCERLVSRLELPADKKVRELSAGNRMKLKLVAALSFIPGLLLLDEPSSGLDPVVRSEFRDILFEYMESGSRAILYSTHILSDISRLADEMTYLSDGKITLRSGKEDLTDKWRAVTARGSDTLPALDEALDVRAEGNRTLIISSDGEATIGKLVQAGWLVEESNPMSLEDISLWILRRGKHVADN